MNEVGAADGETVRVAVPTGVVLRASARVYLVPVAGLVVGAALAQWAAGMLLSAEAAGRAAGIGGIVGAAAGFWLARRIGAARGPVLPRVTGFAEPGSRGRP